MTRRWRLIQRGDRRSSSKKMPKSKNATILAFVPPVDAAHRVRARGRGVGIEGILLAAGVSVTVYDLPS